MGTTLHALVESHCPDPHQSILWELTSTWDFDKHYELMLVLDDYLEGRPERNEWPEDVCLEARHIVEEDMGEYCFQWFFPHELPGHSDGDRVLQSPFGLQWASLLFSLRPLERHHPVRILFYHE